MMFFSVCDRLTSTSSWVLVPAEIAIFDGVYESS
jgi:hypothetical protein